jgi:FkbM family methyltransferase
MVDRVLRWIPENRRQAIAASILQETFTLGSVRGFIRDALVRDGRLVLDRAVLEFPEAGSLQVLVEEILVFENYWFSTPSPQPVIIDGGANFGLASYYFLQIFPHATILAFEPDPVMAAMLRRNADRNNWSNVRVIEAALAPRAGTAVFHSTPRQSMAGSLTDRMRKTGQAGSDYPVACRTLSEFLTQPIDFVKLDIEGAERDVIAEAAVGLDNVSHLFCEFHRQPGKGHDDLAAIVEVLEHARFEVEIAGPSRLDAGSDRGIENVRRRRSLQIWASRSPI